MSKNRNHLVPTVITNKNGTVTTVHKKPTTMTTTTTRMPAVTLPANPKTREALEHEITTLLVQLNYDKPKSELEERIWNSDRTTLLKVLPRYSDETLQRFASIPTELGWKAASRIKVMLRDAPSENYINDWIAIQPVVPNSGLYDEIEYILNSLGEYQKLEPLNNGHYPERRTRQVQAITRVTDHFIRTRDGFDEDINKDRKLMQIIHDEALRDLLTTHENPEAIADIIIARNITDPDQLTALHDTMHRINPALTDGAL